MNQFERSEASKMLDRDAMLQHQGALPAFRSIRQGRCDGRAIEDRAVEDWGMARFEVIERFKPAE